MAIQVVATPHPRAPDQPRRRRRTILFSIVAFGAGALTLVLVTAMLALSLSMKPAYATLDQELSYRLNELAGPDKPVKNVVLRVVSGDGALNWAGAAGTANASTQSAMTADTPIYVASVTKLFTATAIMHLYEQGTLSLDDTLNKYLPKDLISGLDVYQGHDYSQEITIRELLSQTSGLPDYYEDKAADGHSLFELLMADPERSWTVDEEIARARDQMTPRFPAGTAAYYSDTNYQLLGKIIESATGKPLEVSFQQDFFEPPGMQHTWLVGRSLPQIAPQQPIADVFFNNTNITDVRSNTAFWADGGIVSTTNNMIAFLKGLNNGQIVRKDTLQLMHEWRQLENMPFQYGYGTMYFSPSGSADSVLGAMPVWAFGSIASPRTWGHTGSVGSFLYYSQDLDVYVAGTIDQTQDNLAPIMLMARVLTAVRQLT